MSRLPPLQQQARNRVARLVRAAALVFLLAAAPSQAHTAWKIILDGSDITAPCAPIPAGRIPAVNVATVAPLFGIQARIVGNSAVIIDARGIEWRASSGSLSLETTGRSMMLSSPLRMLGGSVYLPVDSLAELAGVFLEIDGEKVMLGKSPKDRTAKGRPAEVEGWEGLTIEKTAEEKAQEARISSPMLPARKPGVSNLPPADRKLDLGFGVGHVIRGDWGNELTANGKVSGVDVGFGTFLTYGRRGIRPLSTRLVLEDEEFGRAAEAGDMFSDIWGLARGVRYSWLAGNERWQSLSLYTRTGEIGPKSLVAAYRDEVPINKELALGSEFTTDKSIFLKGRLQRGPLTLYAYHRNTDTSVGNSLGAFATYELPTRVALYASATKSENPLESSDLQNIGVRIPLKSGVDLTIERSSMAGGTGKRVVDAAMVTFPVGSMRLLGRFNNSNGKIQLLDPDLDPIQMEGRQFTFSAAYLGNSKMTLDYQASLNWDNSSRMARWEQVASTFRLTAKTQLQALTAFPDVFQTNRMQFRLLHALKRDLSLSIDYGALANFQPSTRPRAQRGFMVMLRSTWSAPAPVRGGEISGTVIDQTGRSVENAAVRVGEYKALTDKEGRYVMRRIPPGHYTVALDPDSLPADQKPLGGSRVLQITSRTREKIDFKVIPLNAVTGRVWWDTNGNGKMDETEGVQNIVIRLGDFATVTDVDGSFEFYNVEPGSHTVSLDLARLPLGMVAVSTADVPFTLTPEGTSPKISFQLNKREKETIFEEIP